MGTFDKPCSCKRPTQCQHPYFIRYRDAGGHQREESGFRTQDDAKDRLVALYAQKSKTPASKAELIRHYGQMRFENFVGDYMGRQRRLSYGTVYEYEHLARNHLIPELGSRRVETFTPLVVENFLTTMDRLGTPDPTQFKVFVLLKTLLLDAHRKGAIEGHPLEDVDAPQYEAERAVVPTKERSRDHSAGSAQPRGSRLVRLADRARTRRVRPSIGVRTGCPRGIRPIPSPGRPALGSVRRIRDGPGLGGPGACHRRARQG
ncbi:MULTISPECIES: hypothetical protein [unclassified Streptomyces]|uniref:hypothetical protein n=1 Tax=unclassified Streptomyces TaxID=2593676 RepID=UPI00307884F4